MLKIGDGKTQAAGRGFIKELRRSEKKDLETEQRKTSVTSNAVSGVATGGVDEGGAFPNGQTKATLNNKKVRRLEIRYGRERDEQVMRG